MKRFIYSIVPFIIALVLLQGCKKVTTDGFTSITVYPVINLEGEGSIFVKLGEEYQEPGYSASLDGNDVTEDLVINSNIDIEKAGQYSVVYSMTNEDGFKVEKSRKIYVYDSTPSIIDSKIYTVQKGSNRNGNPEFDGFPVVIYQTAPGVFEISDFLGGYYDYGQSYGSLYAATGSFKLNADNKLSLISSSVAGWGDSLDELKDGKVEQDGTIKFTAAYAEQFEFNVILK